MNQKIPFHQLSARIASATGISEDSAEIFAKNFFDILSEELIKGETVKIKGLGEFALHEEENGEKDIRFIPDKDLAETLNAPFAMFESVTLNDEVTESMLSVEQDQTEASLPEAENPEPESTEETVVCENIAAAIEPTAEAPTEAIHLEEHPESPEPKVEIDPEPATIPAVEKPTQPEEAVQLPVATTSTQAEVIITEPLAKTANSNLAERQPVRPIAPKITPLEEDPEEYVSPTKGQQSEGNFWWGLIIGLIIGLAIGACGVYLAIDHLFPGNRPQAEAIMTEESTPMQAEETTSEIAMPSDSVTSDAEVVQTEAEPEPAPVQPAVAENSSPKVRKDTVKRGYLIHDMAKKFFGSKDYWVYIYEENKSKIGNPNNMQPGVVLDIPDAEKYGIVPGNAESLKKARQKAGEILARYPR